MRVGFYHEGWILSLGLDLIWRAGFSHKSCNFFFITCVICKRFFKFPSVRKIFPQKTHLFLHVFFYVILQIAFSLKIFPTKVALFSSCVFVCVSSNCLWSEIFSHKNCNTQNSSKIQISSKFFKILQHFKFLNNIFKTSNCLKTSNFFELQIFSKTSNFFKTSCFFKIIQNFKIHKNLFKFQISSKFFKT